MNVREIDFEGMTVVVADQHEGFLNDLQPGDSYMAKRNAGWCLLTVREVVPYPTEENGREHGGWVVPVETAYSYDLNECFRVLEIKDAVDV